MGDKDGCVALTTSLSTPGTPFRRLPVHILCWLLPSGAYQKLCLTGKSPAMSSGMVRSDAPSSPVTAEHNLLVMTTFLKVMF